MLLSISQFLGHLHPALVHLPIGVLLIALLLQWLAHKPKYAGLKQAVPITLLVGSITALLSCITGYLLSMGDDYDKTLVSWHMWMGVATALVSLMLYAKEKNPQFGVNKTLLSLGLLVLVFVTGHLGGSLTHGSDYFTQPLTGGSDSSSSAIIKPIANVQEAMVYNDVVQPILQTKCYSCHGANKQKGGLRMDDTTRLMKGGKDGVIILTGKGDESELIKRMLLPKDDDDHMPPKEKSQPTKEQVALLHWWIENGASFTKKVKEVQQPDGIKPALASLQKAAQPAKADISDVPVQPVDAADAATVQQLAAKGIVVIPVAQNINYLQLNFVTDSIVTANDLQLVAKLKKQAVWLKINNTNITDSLLALIGQLTNLTRLDVSDTRITDKGLQHLQTLSNLQYLNLVGTGVTANGVTQLKGLKNLRSLFVYQTAVGKQDYARLKIALPKTTIDTGGYSVPTFASDTTEVKAKQGY